MYYIRTLYSKVKMRIKEEKMKENIRRKLKRGALQLKILQEHLTLRFIHSKEIFLNRHTYKDQ